VVIDLANSGRLLCQPQLTVAVRGASVTRVVSRRLDTILPGDSIPYPLPWPSSLAPGSYAVSANAAGCGAPASLSQVVRAGHVLHGTTSRPVAPRTVRLQELTPWWLLVLIGGCGVLIGLIAGIAVYRRR
jgi:hypothetical protein